MIWHVESVKVAILGIVAMTIASMSVQFDTVIVNAGIAAVTTVLVSSTYLKTRGSTLNQGPESSPMSQGSPL